MLACQQGYVLILIRNGNHEYQWWKYQAVCIFERILNRSQVGGGNLLAHSYRQPDHADPNHLVDIIITSLNSIPASNSADHQDLEHTAN